MRGSVPAALPLIIFGFLPFNWWILSPLNFELGASVSKKEEHGLPRPYDTALLHLFFQFPLPLSSLCVLM